MHIENNNLDVEKIEQIERGKRIKYIRENELKMNKSQLAKEIGVSGQFLGLVESGRGNLVYRSIKNLMDLSGHSSDYILFGLDDSVISETKKYLKKYSSKELINSIDIIKKLTLLLRNKWFNINFIYTYRLSNIY